MVMEVIWLTLCMYDLRKDGFLLLIPLKYLLSSAAELRWSSDLV